MEAETSGFEAKTNTSPRAYLLSEAGPDVNPEASRFRFIRNFQFPSNFRNAGKAGFSGPGRPGSVAARFASLRRADSTKFVRRTCTETPLRSALSLERPFMGDFPNRSMRHNFGPGCTREHEAHREDCNALGRPDVPHFSDWRRSGKFTDMENIRSTASVCVFLNPTRLIVIPE